MTAKVQNSSDYANYVTYQVWIDTTKTLSDGVTPDPNYVKSVDVSKEYPPGISTESDFQNYVISILKQFVDQQNQLMAQTQPTTTPTNTVPVDTSL